MSRHLSPAEPEPSRPIRVLLVDDHPLFREGVRAVLEGDPAVEIVGEAADGDEAVVRAERSDPDVVLMDLRMPGSGGVSAIARLRERVPSARVLVLTTYDGEADTVPAVRAGAAGYLLKDASRAELLAAVRAAARGESVFAATVVGHLVSRSQTEREDSLTEREVKLLELVAEGATNRQAAGRLHVSEATVKADLSRIYARLGVSDRAAAVAAAFQRGILP